MRAKPRQKYAAAFGLFMTEAAREHKASEESREKVCIVEAEHESVKRNCPRRQTAIGSTSFYAVREDWTQRRCVVRHTSRQRGNRANCYYKIKVNLFTRRNVLYSMAA